ncbi:MAG: hypothetical protein ACRC3B_18795, partial [Bacteroidia bacterium]
MKAKVTQVLGCVEKFNGNKRTIFRTWLFAALTSQSKLPTAMQEFIEEIWNDRTLLSGADAQSVIHDVIESLDKGQLRVADPLSDGSWRVNDWVKKAVIMYFPIR